MIYLTQIHISFPVWKYKAKGEDLGSSKMWEEEEDEDEDADSLGISWEVASSCLGIPCLTVFEGSSQRS